MAGVAEPPRSHPPEPRPAATIILLRRGGSHAENRVEVLMVRRGPSASFMPGVWVFPGGVVEPRDRADDEEAAHRACAVRELREEAGISLPNEAELVSWSRWITPEVVPVRFDTRFYVALAPSHSSPRPDGAEAVDAAWLAPRRTLELHSEGEIALVFPTIKHLESLLPYRSADEVLAAARTREVEPVLPKVLGEGGERRVALPGEPGYE
jgi:8-oxo-dGTP pyrophosphatase MutT (NUDIX family)